jgi:hypothetical protein
MLLLWKEHSSYWQIAVPYVLLGIGVGLSGTPSSNSLTGSVPVERVGMASAGQITAAAKASFRAESLAASHPWATSGATRQRWSRS